MPEILNGDGYSEKLEASLHKLIKKVTLDIDNMKFNTAIAAMMTFINDVYDFGSITKDELVIFIKLLNPFAPHLTEEMWESMGNSSFLSIEDWPKYDEAKTIENSIEIAVQINGKLRSIITISKDASKDDAIGCAKADSKVAEAIEGKTVIKEIYVPGKIVNIVVK